MTLEAVVRALANRLTEPTRAGPNVASSTAPSSTPSPNSDLFQPTEKEQATTNDLEASLDRAWDEWTGDAHYLASVELRATFAGYHPLPVMG